MNLAEKTKKINLEYLKLDRLSSVMVLLYDRPYFFLYDRPDFIIIFFFLRLVLQVINILGISIS